MQPVHVCGRLCICASCEKPLLYSAASDQHACSDPNCQYAAGAPDWLELWTKHRSKRTDHHD